MPINITDEFHAATTKGKIASAKEVFLTGDTENLQQIGEKTHQLEDYIKNIAITGGASTAAAVTFDNAASGMTAVTAQAAIDELSSKISEERTRVDSELEKKQPKGDYAQIVNGKIETQVLPFSVNDVLEFSMPDKRLKKLNSSAAGWTKIIYDSDTKRFYATQGGEEDDDTALTPGGIAKPKLLVVYDNWTEREKYQALLTNVPYSGKLYIDIESNKSYRWNGSELEEISAPLGLGETENTAFPGNKGAANTEKIESILKGDLPLASLSITPSWKAYTQTGEVLTFPSTSSLSTIYGYKVTFAGKYKWTKDDAHKAPTAVAGGDWAAKPLPASGEF